MSVPSGWRQIPGIPRIIGKPVTASHGTRRSWIFYKQHDNNRVMVVDNRDGDTREWLAPQVVGVEPVENNPPIASDISVVVLPDPNTFLGDVFVFGRDTHNRIRCSIRRASHPDQDHRFGSWDTLPTTVRFQGDVAVAADPNSGQVFVAARGLDNHTYFIKGTSIGWSAAGWRDLGQTCLGSPALFFHEHSNRLNIFVRGPGSNILTKVWHMGTPDFPAGAWTNLHGFALSNPVPALHGDAVDLFIVGTDNRLYHIRWRNNTWIYESGTHWADRGGALVAGEDPIAVGWDSDHSGLGQEWNVGVFARWNTDNSPRWTKFNQRVLGWTNWAALGGPAADGLAVPQDEMQLDEPRVIAKGSDNHMWELRG